MTIKRNIACLNASLGLTVIVAAPAMADDTELLLSTAEFTGKPNVLFILDTSGSMDTVESTIAFYDSTVPYPVEDGCDSDFYYWNDTGLPPACTASRAIAKIDFVCEAADTQVDGVGSYTGVVAQYRAEPSSGSKWQTLKNGSTGIVECEEDSGEHGDGVSADYFARSGTGGSAFTNDADEEVSWISFPTNLTYTLYDGNYLNYRANPPSADLERIDIVKTVLKKVLSAYDSVNLGLMRFNDVDGGPVIHAMQDLAASRVAFDAKLDAIVPAGNTPLSETFYEAALYWQGLDADYGESVTEHATDPLALASTDPDPEVYRAPPSLLGNCPRNFNILLTDGIPENDADTETRAPGLPGWEAALGRTVCDDYSGEGDCLDDISEYLFKRDISAASGDQSVRTFGVGFNAPAETIALMTETAEITNGKFFVATDPENLATSLLSIFDEIQEQSLTFTTPVVAVNAFNRTQNLNDLYMSVFQSTNRAHWPGNIKKYKIVDAEITDVDGNAVIDPLTGFFDDDAKSFWTVGAADGGKVTAGGAANVLPDPATRKLYTNNTVGSEIDLTAGINALTESNDTAFVTADFGLTGAAGEPTIAEMIRWANGEDVQDGIPAITIRNEMGDPLHSQPAAIDYGTGGTSDVVVYSATNDGYLHAIDSDTGVELWSFVPKELLDNFARLFNNPTERYKQYGIDGDITPIVSDNNGNGEIDVLDGDFVYIVFGLRRGGNSYYALDVTDRTSPILKWNVSHPGFGQSWSAPVITRVNTTSIDLISNPEQAVVIIGGGYDTAHDSPPEPSINDGEGAGVYMLDLQTGAPIWRAGIDGPAELTLNFAGREMNRAIPTKIEVIDINGDRFADRMYAADVGGQVWRFDIIGGQPAASLVTGGIIARFGFEGAATAAGFGPRRIYNSPDASVFTDLQQNRRYIAVSIGTGYRAHPLNDDAQDRFYSLRDPDVFKQLTQLEYNSYDIAVDADMVEVSGKTLTVVSATDRGWRFTMPDEQMILSNSTTFNDSIFFVGFSPEVASTVNCDMTLGKNFLYEVSVINGDPIVDDIGLLPPADSDDARMTALAQGGIAPSPTILFPSPDASCYGAACSPPPIGCVGIECFDPGFANNPVRTLWTQDGIE